MVRMHSIASSRLVHLQAVFGTDLRASARVVVLPFSQPIRVFSQPIRVFLSCPLHIRGAGLTSPFFPSPLGVSSQPIRVLSLPIWVFSQPIRVFAQPIRVLSLSEEHLSLHIADGSVSCGAWRAAHCESQVGRPRVPMCMCVAWNVHDGDDPPDHIRGGGGHWIVKMLGRSRRRGHWVRFDRCLHSQVRRFYTDFSDKFFSLRGKGGRVVDFSVLRAFFSNDVNPPDIGRGRISDGPHCCIYCEI